MYISDDHIFYGSLTLSFLAFLAIVLAFTEVQSTQSLVSFAKSERATSSETHSKRTSFRPSLNAPASKSKLKVAQAILHAGFTCRYMSHLKPMALSGIFQATCLDDASTDKEINYIYNVKSGFVHPL